MLDTSHPPRPPTCWTCGGSTVGSPSDPQHRSGAFCTTLASFDPDACRLHQLLHISADQLASSCRNDVNAVTLRYQQHSPLKYAQGARVLPARPAVRGCGKHSSMVHHLFARSLRSFRLILSYEDSVCFQRSGPLTVQIFCTAVPPWIIVIVLGEMISQHTLKNIRW